MADENSRGRIASLLDGFPPLPGLGPISTRVREAGLDCLPPGVDALLSQVAGERGLMRAFAGGPTSEHAAACVAGEAPEAALTVATARETVESLEGLIGTERLVSRSGEPADVLGSAEGAFDLLYLDGEANGFRRLLDLALTQASVRGVLMFHGLTADASDFEAARAFCGYLSMHPQVRAVILDVGGGVALARKIRPLVTDLGGPY